jgi:general L-amino acid transport system substrate-binding protein
MKLIILVIYILAHMCYADVIATIKARGYLNCGVTSGLPGFSALNEQGQWQGVEVSYCRGIAAAIFNDPTKVVFVPLVNQVQFIALMKKQVDVLARTISVNYTRSLKFKSLFPVIHYFDDATLMVHDKRIQHIEGLNNKTICLVAGSTTEETLTRYAILHGLSYKPLVLNSGQLAVRAFSHGRCDAFAGDRSALYIFRKGMLKPDSVHILEDSFSLEPMSLMVRQEDLDLERLIKWMHYVLVAAEAHGINKQDLQDGSITMDAFIKTLNIHVLQWSDLPQTWMYQVVYHLGNYGALFKANLTDPLGIPRHKNQLIAEGGLMFSPNFN